MHAFHSDTAMQMLARLPGAKEADVPTGAPEVTQHTRNFRKFRAKLIEDGWFKRNALKEVLVGVSSVLYRALAFLLSYF
jgi:hypothetical protein